MKAKNLMSDEVLKIRWKNDMRGFKSKSIKRSRAHKFNYPTVTSASTSRVRWNRSSTASLEGERFETDKIGLSSRFCLSYTFLEVSLSVRRDTHLFVCLYFCQSVGRSGKMIFFSTIKFAESPIYMIFIQTEITLCKDKDK